MSKLRTTLFLYKCPLYQNAAHSLHKHVKIANINKMSTISNTALCCTFPYKLSTISNDYTFATQTCQNCVHTQMSTISITTLLYTKLPKCPLYQTQPFATLLLLQNSFLHFPNESLCKMTKFAHFLFS